MPVTHTFVLLGGEIPSLIFMKNGNINHLSGHEMGMESCRTLLFPRSCGVGCPLCYEKSVITVIYLVAVNETKLLDFLWEGTENCILISSYYGLKRFYCVLCKFGVGLKIKTWLWVSLLSWIIFKFLSQLQSYYYILLFD
jgi:hypothetical protein